MASNHNSIVVDIRFAYWASKIHLSFGRHYSSLRCSAITLKGVLTSVNVRFNYDNFALGMRSKKCIASSIGCPNGSNIPLITDQTLTLTSHTVIESLPTNEILTINY